MPRGFPKKGFRQMKMKKCLCSICKKETCAIYAGGKRVKCHNCTMLILTQKIELIGVRR